MREDEIYRLVPRRRVLSIVCNVFGIVCLTGAVFVWPMRIAHVHYITLGMGIIGGILLTMGILFHVSDSLRHKGRIRQLERRWDREERARSAGEERDGGEEKPDVKSRRGD